MIKKQLTRFIILMSCLLCACMDGNYTLKISDGVANQQPDNNATQASSTALTQTWNFATSTGYTFDGNFVEFSSGLASIKSIDLKTNTQTEFDSGSNTGTIFSSGELSIGSNGGCNGLATNCAELNANWAPKYHQLVGYWKFNNNWQSSVGTNHGTANGNLATSTNAKLGSHAAVFDGSGDYLRISGPTNIPSGGAKRTIAAWIKFNGNGGTIVSFHTSSGQRFHFQTTYVNPMWYVFSDGDNANNNLAATGTQVAFAGKWQHVALTLDDSNNWAYYLNGAQTRTGTFSISINTGPISDVTIGNRLDFSQDYNGSIDEVAIWKDQLSASDIELIYQMQKAKYAGLYTTNPIDASTSTSWPSMAWQTPLPFGKPLPGSSGNEDSDDYIGLYESGTSTINSGIVGLWHFDDSLNDTSGNGNHCSITAGTPKFVTQGRIGRAISANNEGDYLSCGSTNIPVSNTVSISAWAYYYTDPLAGDFDYIYSLGGAGWNGDLRNLARSPDKKFYYARNSVAHSSSSTLSSGEWHHIVMVFRSSAPYVKAYLNGKVEVIDQPAAAVVPVSSAVTVGASGIAGNQHFLDGKVDELAIWNRELSLTEVKEIYRRGANRISFKARSCDDNACVGERWNGPQHATSSFFSEWYNNSTIDPTTASPTGSVLTTAPFMVFSDFLNPSGSNRYFQYQMLLESDDEGLACSASSTCVPSVSQVSLHPHAGNSVAGAEQVSYANGNFNVENTSAISFSSLSSIAITHTGACIQGYQVSNDNGATYRYYNGSIWALASNSTTHLSTKAQLESNISSLSVGSGQFKFRAILNSNGVQSCSIDNIQLNYNP